MFLAANPVKRASQPVQPGLIDSASTVRMMRELPHGIARWVQCVMVDLRPLNRCGETSMNDEVIITCAVTGAGDTVSAGEVLARGLLFSTGRAV